MKYSYLYRVTVTHYKKDGKNSLPHIRRVLRSAIRLADRRKKPLTMVEVAAILLHDLNKVDAEKAKIDHGVWAAGIARTLLRGHLTPSEIDTVCEAIALHNVDIPTTLPEATMLRAVDASIPDVGWYARKSVNTMMVKYGWSREQALENALKNIKDGRVWLGHLENVPAEWHMLWKEQISLAKELAIKINTTEQVDELIAAYEESHPGESLYV